MLLLGANKLDLKQEEMYSSLNSGRECSYGAADDTRLRKENYTEAAVACLKEVEK